MRKYKTILIVLVLGLISLTSCQKIIHLDLSSSVPQLVIQGNIYDQAGPFVVTVSKTVDFDALNIYPAVTNASVSISDDAGNSEELSQGIDGTYVTSTTEGIPGRTYRLTVVVDGKTYSASSTMHEATTIDSTYFRDAPFGGAKLVAINFINLSGTENYYRVIHFLNGKQATAFSVFSENASQTDTVSYSFMATNVTPTITQPKLVKGDIIEVWLECLDKGVFDYFRTANSEGGQNASPANPVSNISNGAMGYFNACPVRKKQVIYY
jgi:hypothetical protein